MICKASVEIRSAGLELMRRFAGSFGKIMERGK